MGVPSTGITWRGLWPKFLTLVVLALAFGCGVATGYGLRHFHGAEFIVTEVVGAVDPRPLTSYPYVTEDPPPFAGDTRELGRMGVLEQPRSAVPDVRLPEELEIDL